MLIETVAIFRYFSGSLPQQHFYNLEIPTLPYAGRF